MISRAGVHQYRDGFLVAVLVAVLVACSSGGGKADAVGVDAGADQGPTGDAPANTDVAEAGDLEIDYGAPVVQTLGAEGGTVDGPGAVTVEIPANALTEDTEIEVAVVDEEPEEETLDPVGPTVEFGPAGTTFAAPVTVTLPYNEAALGGAGNEAKVQLWWAETLAGPWVALESEVDEAANTVTAEVSHFSFGVAGLTECLPHCGGALCGDDGCGGSCGTCEGADDACIEGRCVPQGTPTPGTLWGHLGKDDTYFDFEGGTATNDPTRGDIEFEHTAIIGDWWVSSLVMTGAFIDPDKDGVRDFGLFSTVESADGLDLQKQSLAPEAGFVYVLKTNLDKLAKIQIISTSFKLGDEGAPSVDFIYMYDNFADTVPPSPRLVRILENSYNPSTGKQVELARVDYSSGTLEVTVKAAPSHVEIHFNEAIVLPTDAGQVYDRGLLEVVRVDQTGFSAQLKFSSINQDHFYRAFGVIATDGFDMITEPGTYELRAAPLSEGQTGYFKDYSGNELKTWPAVVRIIYSPQR